MSRARKILESIGPYPEDSNVVHQRVYVECSEVEGEPDSDENLGMAGNRLLMWLESEGLRSEVMWDEMHYVGAERQGSDHYYVYYANIEFSGQTAKQQWLEAIGNGFLDIGPQ